MQLRDICLSMALSKMLNRRFAGFKLAEAGLPRTRDFVFKGLLDWDDKNKLLPGDEKNELVAGDDKYELQRCTSGARPPTRQDDGAKVPVTR
jgi:hypothetical protein